LEKIIGIQKSAGKVRKKWINSFGENEGKTNSPWCGTIWVRPIF